MYIFPQVSSHCITIWPPGGHSCIMYTFPTDPIIPHHQLASRRPHMHHVYFSHRFHHTTSPSGLQETTHASCIFFPEVLSYHTTIWPPEGHSCMMYIFPTGLITLHHHLTSGRPLMHDVYFSHRFHHTTSPSGLQEATHASCIFFPQVSSHCITI